MEKKQISGQLYIKKQLKLEKMKERINQLNAEVIEEFANADRTDANGIITPTKTQRDLAIIEMQNLRNELSGYIVVDDKVNSDPKKVELGDVVEVLITDEAKFYERFECVVLEDIELYNAEEKAELYPNIDENDFTSKNSPVGSAILGGRAGMTTPIELPIIHGTKEFTLKIIEITKFENINAKKIELK